jgi:uncharacterized protein YbaR (Trm112 family)
MRDDLLTILADPETRGPLTRASDDELQALRAALAAGTARRRDGAPAGAFESAFLRADRRVAYLVEAGIPNFVVDEGVELDAPL